MPATCQPGEYMKDSGTQKQCAKCKEGYFTATENALNTCHICTVCSSDNQQTTVKNCSTTENTVCECRSGFYCSNNSCDHCLKVENCPMGEGVRVQATRISNTVCEKCQNGTYSNVVDAVSPCQPHTRCEDIGKQLKTPGTSEINAACGDYLGGGGGQWQWQLPAGLWAGLVVTALILFAVVIYRKARRRSYRAGSFSRPVTLVKPLELSLPATSLDLSLPDPKGNGYCQESCAVEEFKLPLFSQDESLVSCSMDSSLPITPLKVSVSFVEVNDNNKGSGYCPGNFLRTPSEPQEDEWWGT